MNNYLTKEFDWNRSDLVSQYDELPLWSAPFGQILLDNVPLCGVSDYLDIGFGTGFPLIDISQRIGNSCNSYGIDPWNAAVKRCEEKICSLGLTNISINSEKIEDVKFNDESFDLITSNLGLNNFENPQLALSVINRLLRKNGSFCATTNLLGCFSEFYEIFLKIAHANIELVDVQALEKHIQHRGTIQSIEAMVISSGFEIVTKIDSKFRLRYANGSSFLNHSVITSGFLPSWKSVIKPDAHELIFALIEKHLNGLAARNNGFEVTIPIMYFEARKIQPIFQTDSLR